MMHSQKNIKLCSQVCYKFLKSISVLWVFTFLQTVIKELILKFKVKENHHGIKRGTIILQYCI